MNKEPILNNKTNHTNGALTHSKSILPLVRYSNTPFLVSWLYLTAPLQGSHVPPHHHPWRAVSAGLAGRMLETAKDNYCKCPCCRGRPQSRCLCLGLIHFSPHSSSHFLCECIVAKRHWEKVTAMCFHSSGCYFNLLCSVFVALTITLKRQQSSYTLITKTPWHLISTHLWL